LVSLASRNDGELIETNSCNSLELAAADIFWIYGATFATIASNAGYTAPSFPLLVVIRL